MCVDERHRRSQAAGLGNHKPKDQSANTEKAARLIQLARQIGHRVAVIQPIGSIAVGATAVPTGLPGVSRRQVLRRAAPEAKADCAHSDFGSDAHRPEDQRKGYLSGTARLSEPL